MNSIRFLLRLLFLPVFTISLPTIRAMAQSAETLAQFAKGSHLGAISDALVGVEVTHTAEGAETVVRRGNGFLLRCDGFVLLPASLLTLPPQQTDKIVTSKVVITLHPGTEEERRVSTTLPRRLPTDLRYTVVKLRNVHVPAIRTLLSAALKEGDTLEAVWCDWNPEIKRFQPPRKRVVEIGKPDTSDRSVPGTLSFAASLEGVPAGAVLIGPEQMAVGMVASSGQATRFLTMDALERVTNCVTPLPTTNKAFAEKRPLLTRLTQQVTILPEEPVADEPIPEPDAVPGMVKVPGGPVQLAPGVLALQRDMQGATTACVAPFLIDRYEVTNGQYLAFWNALTEKQRRDLRNTLFPVSWADSELYFPENMVNHPVLGVTYAAASAYAAWVGKRLPTPYEWCLAAFGPTGGNVLPDWAKRFVADRQKTWKEVTEAHLRYLNQHPALLQQYTTAQMKRANPSLIGQGRGEILTGEEAKERRPVPFSEPYLREMFLPWYFYRDDQLNAVRWSKSTVLNAVAPLFETYKSPQHILATGARDFDVSPYGVHDMALNAFEVVCPYPERRAVGTARYLIYEGAYFMRTQWTGPIREILTSPIDPKRSETYFFAWFEGADFPGRLDDIKLLSRRLRSATSNAATDFTVWPNQYPRNVAAANIYEIALMLPPLTGWEVLLVPGPTIAGTPLSGVNINASERPNISPLADGPFDSPVSPLPANRRVESLYAQSSYMMWDETPSFAIWKEMPKYFVQEMGRPYDKEAPEGRNVPGIHHNGPVLKGGAYRTGAIETYLVPGGFRCVR